MMRALLTALIALLLAACGSDPAAPPTPAPRASNAAEPKRVEAPNVFCDDAGQYFSTRDGAALLLIPGGDVTLGDTEGRYDERPAFTARLGAFLIDTTEVSNAQFERFVNASGYAPQGPWRRAFAPGQEDQPVRFVTWHDARAYAQWAGRSLPTEAQWEAACGAKRYPWGDEWLRGCSITDRDLDRGPVDVGIATDRSPFGVLNLGGNVREWCADWYDRQAYQDYARLERAENPSGPADGALPREEIAKAGAVAGNERSTRKVVRGGSWASDGRESARKARRNAHNPHQWFDDVGFRCVQSVEAKP